MAHFEDCKFYRQRACLNGVQCGFRHNEASRHTERLCNRWAAGYTCDGRCNLRHPSTAEIAALAAAPPPASAATAAAVVRSSPSRQQPPNNSRPSAAAEAVAAAAAAAAAAAVVQPAPSRQKPPKNSRPPAAAAAAAATAAAAAAAAAEAAAAAIKARAPPCRYYARGLCTKGRACPFFHAPSAQQVPAEPTAPESSRRPAPTTLRGAAAAARKTAAASGARAASGEKWRQQKGGAAGKREAGGTERPRKTVKNSGGGLGVSVEADAAAKRRAAEILQKHRLTSSTPAKEAGSRGGMHVRGAARTHHSDKKICAETSGQRQSRPPTGRHSGHSSTALASPPEAAEASSKVRTIPADNNGKNTGAKSGKRVGEQEEAAGAEEAPACEGAVLHAPSPKKQAIEETPSTTARAATKAVGKLKNTARAEGATSTSCEPADEQQGQQQGQHQGQQLPSNAGSDAPSPLPTSCATTAAVVANDKEELLPSRSGSA